MRRKPVGTGPCACPERIQPDRGQPPRVVPLRHSGKPSPSGLLNNPLLGVATPQPPLSGGLFQQPPSVGFGLNPCTRSALRPAAPRAGRSGFRAGFSPLPGKFRASRPVFARLPIARQMRMRCLRMDSSFVASTPPFGPKRRKEMKSPGLSPATSAQKTRAGDEAESDLAPSPPVRTSRVVGR